MASRVRITQLNDFVVINKVQYTQKLTNTTQYRYTFTYAMLLILFPATKHRVSHSLHIPRAEFVCVHGFAFHQRIIYSKLLLLRNLCSYKKQLETFMHIRSFCSRYLIVTKASRISAKYPFDTLKRISIMILSYTHALHVAAAYMQIYLFSLCHCWH